MVVGLAQATAQSFLNVLRNTAFAAIAAPAVGVHTADPGVAGLTAVSGGSSTRNAATWSAATTAGTMALSTLAAWTNAATTETISHLSIWTAVAGSFYWSGALTTPQAWVATNTLTITTLTLNVLPIAA